MGKSTISPEVVKIIRKSVDEAVKKLQRQSSRQTGNLMLHSGTTLPKGSNGEADKEVINVRG